MNTRKLQQGPVLVRCLAGVLVGSLVGAGCGDEAADPSTFPGLLTFDPVDGGADASSDTEGNRRDGGKPGSDGGKPGGGDGDAQGDSDAEVQESDAGTDDDAGLPGEDGPSNTPWATLRYAGAGPSAGISVVASNLTQEESADEYYVQWYVVVENAGSEPVCSVLIPATFLDDNGSELLKLTAGVDATMFASKYTSGTVYECIPPGGKVGGYANGFIDERIDLNEIAQIDYGVGGSIGASIITNPPTVNNRAIVPKFNGYALTGTLTATSFSLINPSVNVYPLTPGGMPIERITDIEILTVSAYGSWSFSTTAADALFDDYLLTVQYSR
jgi:hypothetical protein